MREFFEYEVEKEHSYETWISEGLFVTLEGALSHIDWLIVDDFEVYGEPKPYRVIKREVIKCVD